MAAVVTTVAIIFYNEPGLESFPNPRLIFRDFFYSPFRFTGSVSFCAVSLFLMCATSLPVLTRFLCRTGIAKREAHQTVRPYSQ